jgi:hypothetical protein
MNIKDKFGSKINIITILFKYSDQKVAASDHRKTQQTRPTSVIIARGTTLRDVEISSHTLPTLSR